MNEMHEPHLVGVMCASLTRKFNEDGPDGIKNYFNDLRTCEKIQLRRKGGGKSDMVWDDFSERSKSKIAFINGI